MIASLFDSSALRSIRPVLAGAAVVFAFALPVSAHVEKHFNVQGRPVVILQDASGHIEIKSWKKQEVLVVGDESSKNVMIDTEQAGSRIEVDTQIVDSSARPADLQANYVITVPEETELQIRTESGSIVVESVHGDLTFETILGDVNLQDVGGMLSIKSTEGTIICTRCDGSISAQTVSGNVKLFQPIMDHVTVHTTAGNIFFDGDFLKHGIYLLKSDTGNTEVRFGKASSFDLTATSVQGTVFNQAKLQPDKHSHHLKLPKFSTSAAFVSGTYGDGNAKVELSSFSGTIKISSRD
jgi:DUF4097 and DUF4098 domain-containing protein YvlB